MDALKHDITLDVALGNSRKTKTWKNKTMAWSELLARLANTTRTPETVAEYKTMGRDQQSDIKDVGGFVTSTSFHFARDDNIFRFLINK